MKRRILFALLTLPLSCAGQGLTSIDSQLTILRKLERDTGKVSLLCNIASDYYSINPDSGLRYGYEALKLAEALDWQEGQAMAWNAIGNNYYSQPNDPAALDAFFKELKIAEAAGGLLHYQGRALANIGNIYDQEKNTAKAEAFYRSALRIMEKSGDRHNVRVVKSNLIGIYIDQGKYVEALPQVRETLRMAEAEDDQEGITLDLSTIGDIYSKQRKYAQALPYSFRALRLSYKTGQKKFTADGLGAIGNIYLSIARDSLAVPPDSLIPAGKSANLQKAVFYLRQAIAENVANGFKEPIPGNAESLSDALALQGNYKGALEAYRQSATVKDSLFNTANKEQIAGLETRRAEELKDKDIQIAKLKKRNERILFIAGFGMLLLIMGILFRSFRKQRQANVLVSREKQRSDDLLLNILPAEVAEELKDKGAATARHYESVSVLFTDFVDFTSAAEKLSPQALVQELHECFTAFDAIIERNGLEKIKTIGDAYMAACGLPVRNPRHALQVVQAAIEIREFNEARSRDGINRAATFQIRIGIHSGPVVAGIVGVKKFAYDIWGDTVNTAARMEQHSEPGRINISGATYELVKNTFTCAYRGALEAKHKGKLEMYFVEQ